MSPTRTSSARRKVRAPHARRGPLRQSLWRVLLFLFSGLAAAGAEKPNVLLIAIDDLNDWVGCLGGHPDAKTPNIDRLAARGTLFANAHCQAPICNPSRTSLMLGLRPSTTGVYMNSPKHWTVPALKERVTLPRHFARNGYETLTTGKIYHGSGLPENDFDTVGPRPGQMNRKRDVRREPELKGLWDFGPQEYDERLFTDYVDAQWAIERLADRERDGKPFFMAVGFYRPHVPFYAPARHFRSFPLAEVDLPVVMADDRADLPAKALEVTANNTPPPHDWFVKNGKWRRAVQSYLACNLWTDEQVGRLLDALDASPHAMNTVIVLYSDHGFHLGEKRRWAKQSLWERSTRVPFIVSVPHGKPGRCARPVELLDIYPTLVDVCGLPSHDGLEGASLAPLLADPQSAREQPAITTYGKGNHSVRSERWRYIRYADGSEELYDHRSDPGEWTNLAGDASKADILAEHAKWLPKENAEAAKAPPASGKKPKRNGRATP